MTDPRAPDADPLLEVRGLETHFPITEGLLRRRVGRIRAVDGVSFSIDRGGALGIVGESGCGKTTLALSTLRLVEPTGGEIVFDGRDVTALGGRELRAYRRRAQLVVQDPNEALNPRMTIGEAVEEPLVLHGMRDDERRRAIVADLLQRVGLSAADADRYPHEFSGGEKQRIAIARAVVLNPDLIIADEPTSALDGRVQSDVLGLLDEIRREYDIAVLLISHDIDVIDRFCDRVAVMYLGELVEEGPVDEVLGAPAHPYTRVLVGSVPSLDPRERRRTQPVSDALPDPADPPSGCRFHTRCPEVIPAVGVDVPGDVWRALTRLRFTLQAGELPDEVEGAATGAAADGDRIREVFGLPGTIPDDEIDGAVDAAIDALAEGRVEAAVEAVTAAVPTYCERHDPSAVARNGGAVSCHRYDAAVDAEPLPWPDAPGVADG